MDDETRLAVALEKVESMSADLKDIKDALKELTKEMVRLRIVEERQTAAGESLGRAFAEIKRVETEHDVDIKSLGTRIGVLESERPTNKWTNSLVQKIVGWILVFVLGVVVSGSIRPQIPSGPTTVITTPAK